MFTALVSELLEIVTELDAFVSEAINLGAMSLLDALENSANKVGRSWSGSWIGYQANVYYKDLTKPPPGAHFSSEWGFINGYISGTRGEWVEFDPDHVTNQIEEEAKYPEIKPATEVADRGNILFADKRTQIISILEA